MVLIFLIKNIMLSLLTQNNNHLKIYIMTAAKKLTAAEIYIQTNSLVFGYVLGKVGNKAVAEDITGDTFLKVAKFYKSFDKKKAKLSTWVITIANNAILDYYRSRLNKDNVKTNSISGYVDSEGNETFVLPSTKQADTDILNSELRTKINIAFEKLTPNQFNVANLFFNKQYSLKEIMSELNLPESTIKVTILRARKVLQANLKPVSTKKMILA